MANNSPLRPREHVELLDVLGVRQVLGDARRLVRVELLALPEPERVVAELDVLPLAVGPRGEPTRRLEEQRRQRRLDGRVEHPRLGAVLRTPETVLAVRVRRHAHRHRAGRFVFLVQLQKLQQQWNTVQLFKNF